MNKLYIESSPEGAHIFLSGIYTEKRTPAWLLNLEPGSYQITLKLGGLIDSTVVVTLNDNATKTIIVKMEN
ncbi:MAG: PEGA domain-containing protein [Melioribacteraceae bacterium]|nr:PEGA domain-containing protein [Melioribacteraceae bacterium]